MEELEREMGITGAIKLASNENALGPSPKAVEAIKAVLAKLHLYPDGSCYYLAEALAGKLGVSPRQIVFGNGSNEVISFLVAAFVAPGDEVIVGQPTFLMYQKIVQARGGEAKIVPLRNMVHNLDGILDALSDRTRLIFLDNPNNPTGTVIDKREFDEFLNKLPEGVLVVLDEAYVDFAEPAGRIDVIGYLNSNAPVISLRTFSKAYGLAGLRVGFGLMSTEIADMLHRVRQPFNINHLAQVGALAAIADEEHYRRTIEMTRNGIRWLRSEMEKLGCHTYPTQANFFLADVGNGRKVYDALLLEGVIIRPMESYGYPSFVRITVGLPEENSRLIESLKKVLAGAKGS